jgi:hypothetical protein
MSLNEIAVDLTCQTEEFEPASAPEPGDSDEDGPSVPGRFAFPRKRRSNSTASTCGSRFSAYFFLHHQI